MRTDLAADFSELKRPKSFIGAALRFLAFCLGAALLYFIAPNSWGEWRMGLSTGLAAGFLWAVSWCWKGNENRVIVWLMVYLGVMAFWGARYRDFPSLGALACMYVGFDFALLVLHSPLKAWSCKVAERDDDRTTPPS